MSTRKFTSEDELRRFALSKGAAVSVDDTEFNAARTQQRIAAIPKYTPAPTPPPPPQPEVVVMDNSPSLDAMRQQTEAVVQLLEELKREVRQAPMTGSPAPSEWEFTIVRDQNGLIQKITAKATRVPVH